MLIRRSAAIALLLISVGCTASFPATPTDNSTPSTPVVTGLIALYPTFGTRLVAGDISAFFEAYTVDSDGGYVRVTQSGEWSSSNPSVLRADGRGSFYPVTAGTADVRVVYQGLVASLFVAVRQPPNLPYLRISSSGASDAPSLSVTLVNTSVFQPVDAGVAWTSSDPAVLTVESGRARQKAVGNVELRASYQGLSEPFWISSPPRAR